MTEAELLAAVRKLARLCGWRVYHTHDSRRSEAGWPDLAMVNVRQSRFLVAELKAEAGRLSAEQKVWLADLTAVGVECHVWRPGDLRDIVPAVLNGSHRPTPKEMP